MAKGGLKTLSAEWLEEKTDKELGNIAATLIFIMLGPRALYALSDQVGEWKKKEPPLMRSTPASAWTPLKKAVEHYVGEFYAIHLGLKDYAAVPRHVHDELLAALRVRALPMETP